MEGKRLIEKIKLRNILSFGDKGEEIELQPLNVLIGQNGSGKSNFIDIFKFLHTLIEKNQLVSFISKNGGITEWIWNGKKEAQFAEITLQINLHFQLRCKYEINFQQKFQRLSILKEIISIEDIIEEFDYSSELLLQNSTLSTIRAYKSDEIAASINFLKNHISAFLFYTDLETNRSAEIRNPQPTDALNNFLEEDGSNLALVLNDLEHRSDTKDKIVEYLKKFNPRIKDYSIRILGGTVQLFIREEGLEKPISAMRLSDGTLRYLCLLTILLHPEPPPLICIEEPEVGLHPDILPTIGELLIDASKRTQLIVTTHSDILVSALSEIPEAVLVCESDEDGTHLKRLDKDKMKAWLEEYELGDLWLKGEIGGKRW